MRRIIQGLVLAIGIGLAGLSSVSAAPVSADGAQGIAAQGAGVHKVYYGGYCERLRYRCTHKYELGLEGEGACRRFREECGGDRQNYCRRLWRACEYKHERGQEGMGNCRRFREECGGSR